MRRNVSSSNLSSGDLQKLQQSKSALRLSQLEGGAVGSPLLENTTIQRHRNSQRIVKLKRGTCSYCIYGAPIDNSKGLIICIHGLTLASYVFTDLTTYFQSKWTILTFDLFGRGSSTLNNSNNILDDNFYVNQLQELLQALDLWDRRVTLLGCSLGGGIAVSFCAQFPEKVERMILVAPVGLMPENALPWVARLHSSFGCLGRIAHYFLERCCVGCVEQYLVDSFQYSRWAEFFLEDVKQSHFIANYWNTLKTFPFSDMQNVYRRVRDTSDCDILVIWGKEDRIVPFDETSMSVMKSLPRAKLVSWKDVGHEITVGDGGKLVTSWMNQAISDFLCGR
eukprot:g7443.t1